MRFYGLFSTALMAGLLCCGCASYHVRSAVPADKRTISVAEFENESGFPEIDAIVTQYTLRELQREGTFKLAKPGDAALKIFGRVTRSHAEGIHYDRNYNARASEYRHTLTVRFSLWDTATGKMLIDDQPVKVNSTFMTRGDMLTGLQDSMPRLAKDAARTIVDTVLAQWSPEK